MHRRLIPLIAVSLALVPVVSAETTRSLRAELPSDTGAFVVENLAGVMTVAAGDVTGVVAVATVHADSATLADSVSLDTVREENGDVKLLVRYPVRTHSKFRYPDAAGGSFFGLDGGSHLEYDGRRVRVSGSSGVLLWAEVKITVPRSQIQGTFKNHVGRLEADGARGRVRLDTASGDVIARDLEGDVELDTGSGDARAEAVRGTLDCDTGSGDCLITHFEGGLLKCDTGSGDIRIQDAVAQRIDADTGSGDVTVVDADTVEFRGDTGSGSITLEAVGNRLQRVAADTGSGDVLVRLPADATFTAYADQGSGDLVSRFDDARAIVKRRNVVGYERGDGRIRIDADTGSGDVTIAPRR